MTLSIVKTGVMGDLRYTIADVTFDGAYPAGGEAVSAADLLFTEAVYAASADGTDGADNYAAVYDISNGKLLLFESSADGVAFDEVGAGDVDGWVVRIFAVGK